MSKSKSVIPPARSPVFHYGLAVLVVALALGKKLTLLQFNFAYTVSALFLFAIAIAFWFWGKPTVSSAFCFQSWRLAISLPLSSCVGRESDEP